MIGFLSLMIVTVRLETAQPAGLAPAAAMRDPGFESSSVVDGWDVVTYGARADVRPDRTVVQEGRQSLRITVSEPSDTALGQEMALRPGGWYRFSGWVRTSGLDPRDAPVCGTYQIQRAGGKGTVASSASHPGDNDWTEVVLVFQAPADGRVRIAPFLVGFGNGTGTAWFDGMKLEAFEPSRAPAIITREFLQSGRIEPGQYGQFIEYLCNLVPGIWADKLCDDADLPCPAGLRDDGRRPTAPGRLVPAGHLRARPDAKMAADGKSVVVFAVNDQRESIDRTWISPPPAVTIRPSRSRP